MPICLCPANEVAALVLAKLLKSCACQKHARQPWVFRRSASRVIVLHPVNGRLVLLDRSPGTGAKFFSFLDTCCEGVGTLVVVLQLRKAMLAPETNMVGSCQQILA